METAENVQNEPEKTPQGPEDKHSLIYWACVLCGASFMMPFNCVILSVDYFDTTYPGTNIVFGISVSYLVVLWLTSTLSTLTVEFFNPTIKIFFGFAMVMLSLLYLTIFESWLRPFPKDVTYILLLICVVILSFSAAVIEVNLYGLFSMLPKKYRQGITTGEGTAGVLTAILRVVTKASVANLQTSTILFFASCLLFTIVCLVVFILARRAKYLIYYVEMCGKEKGSGDKTQLIKTDQLNVETGKAIASGSTAGGVAVGNGTHSGNVTVREPLSSRLRRALDVRVDVIGTIWPYMLAVFITYAITLSVFPGLSSQVVSCSLGTWMPVIMLSVFNVADLIGKITVRWEPEWPKLRLVLCSAARVIFVPLFILCSKPRSQPIISGEALPIIFSIINGFTNGHLGAMPIVIGPTKVSPEKREMAGDLTVFALTTGLAVGSAVAYGYLAILGPATPGNNPCGLQNVTTSTP